MKRVLLVSLLLVCVAESRAQTMRFDIGPRAVIKLADGEPANDMIGNGVFLNYRFTDAWAVSVAYEQVAYDFEQPARFIGLVQDPSLDPIDAEAETAIVSASIRRNYLRGRARTSWFWSLGAGLADTEVDDAGGPLASGGEFIIETDAGSEVVALAMLGVNVRLLDRFYLELALRADQHFADWVVRDLNSGASGTVGDYLTTGGHFGIGLRF